MPAAEPSPIDDVAILGTGTAFPDLELTNVQVLQLLRPSLWASRAHPPDDDELQFVAASLEKTMGVQRRRWSHLPNQPLDHANELTVLDLATRAAQAALADANAPLEAVSLVLCATSTPHRMTSTVSAQVAHRLGLRCAALDTRTGCSGALFALATGALFARAGCGLVLVIGADTFSKVLPPHSKLAALSLGDGAGALVLGHRPGSRIDALYLETDGGLGKLITTEGPLPPTHEDLDRGGYLLSGAPDDLTAVVPHKYHQALTAVLAKAGADPKRVALYAPHQTSVPLVKAVASRIGVEPERTFINVAEHANIGAAGWLVALAESKSRLRRGDTVLTASVGGGMSWAAAVLTW